MSLSTGARLGPYEILGALGVGGMGEVCRWLVRSRIAGPLRLTHRWRLRGLNALNFGRRRAVENVG